MKNKRYRILTAVVLSVMGLYSGYKTFENHTLRKKINKKDKTISELEERVSAQAELIPIDSLLIDGNDYNGALKAYQNKMKTDALTGNLQLEWRMAVAKKMAHLQRGAHPFSNPEQIVEYEEDKNALIVAKQINEKDSLQFELEKARVQLTRLKKQLSLKGANGEYLKFETPKGSKLHYVGQVIEGRANGYGVALLSTGSRYQGYWKNNLRHGEGVFYWSDGEYYEGTYQNDMRSGHGSYFWPNGEKYVGEWKDDKRYGRGKFYAKDGSIITKGIWKNDKLVSQTKPNKTGKNNDARQALAVLK